MIYLNIYAYQKIVLLYMTDCKMGQKGQRS